MTASSSHGGGGIAAAYAAAMLTVAQAEGNLDRLENGLYRFARSLDENSNLRDRLTDPAVDLAAKLEIIDELVGGHPETASAVMWLVQSGRGREIHEVADEFVRQASAARGTSVAEVRTARALDEAQQERLVQAISAQVGRPVELKVVTDPNVVGGIVVKIGDEVIDGSVARRLAELRAALTGA